MRKLSEHRYPLWNLYPNSKKIVFLPNFQKQNVDKYPIRVDDSGVKIIGFGRCSDSARTVFG